MPEFITSCEERDKELEALSHSLAQSYEELALLHRISDRMTVTQEPEEFFHNLCQDLKEVLEVSKLLVLWNVQDTPENSFSKVISRANRSFRKPIRSFSGSGFCDKPTSPPRF
jgi:hypothetical protein